MCIAIKQCERIQNGSLTAAVLLHRYVWSYSSSKWHEGLAMGMMQCMCFATTLWQLSTLRTGMSHLRLKAHVKHAVCFIKYKVGDPEHGACLHLDQINHPSRCTNSNLHMTHHT